MGTWLVLAVTTCGSTVAVLVFSSIFEGRGKFGRTISDLLLEKLSSEYVTRASVVVDLILVTIHAIAPLLVGLCAKINFNSLLQYSVLLLNE